MLASKEIPENYYRNWADRYLKASTSFQKDVEIEKLQEEIEVEFDLIGSTAIEDKLQEEVGRTIFDLR